MDLHDLLFVILIFLAATAVCVALFDRLGLGSIVGFIVAGILIGPHTPGPVASTQVDQLRHVSELGIVLFMSEYRYLIEEIVEPFKFILMM